MRMENLLWADFSLGIAQEGYVTTKRCGSPSERT
jgi:hypothetical protein